MSRHGILLFLASAALAVGQTPTGPTMLERAIRAADSSLVRAALRQGVDPNELESSGKRPLADAASAGQVETIRLLLAAGARVDAASPGGRTALIEAAEQGHLDAVRLLIGAGANVNLGDRSGTPLEIAERAGNQEMVALLRAAGARTSGRSVGDTVCVRPWKGDGYCGTVEAVSQGDYRIQVTKVVGCAGGCTARADCSAGKIVGAAGLRAGDTVTVPGSCLTHTGVRP